MGLVFRLIRRRPPSKSPLIHVRYFHTWITESVPIGYFSSATSPLLHHPSLLSTSLPEASLFEMASDSDTVCSYKELFDSEHSHGTEDMLPFKNPPSSSWRENWPLAAFALGCTFALLLYASTVVNYWHISNELANIHRLFQLGPQNSSPNLTCASETQSHQDGGHLGPDGSGPIIDGIEVPGYRLQYNASYCGEVVNPAGAFAQGCVLDRVQGGWVPEICSDRELRQQWDAMPDFGWYLDEARTQKISQERVYRGDADLVGRSLYTGVNYHLTHCVAVLRLRHNNNLRRDRGMTFHMLSHHHIEHCFDRFLDWLTPEGLENTRKPTEIIFSSAGVVSNKDERTAECYVPV